jgi:hypothetical protein
MNSLALMLVALVAAVLAPVMVMAQSSLLVNFNNGRVDSNKYCPPSEWITVQQAIARVGSLNQRRRHLRQQNERRLTCRYCGPLCYWPAPGCPNRGRRRRLEESGGTTERAAAAAGGTLRQLENTTAVPSVASLQCNSTTIAAMHAAITALQPSLSSTCRALVATRTVECASVATECGILAVQLVNATSDTVLGKDLVSDEMVHFCKTDHVTFHAVTDFFIGRVNFVVQSMSGAGTYFANRTETVEPYYMHGNMGTEIDGTYFPVGNYSLTVTSEYDPMQSKTFRFRSNRC